MLVRADFCKAMHLTNLYNAAQTRCVMKSILENLIGRFAVCETPFPRVHGGAVAALRFGNACGPTHMVGICDTYVKGDSCDGNEGCEAWNS